MLLGEISSSRHYSKKYYKGKNKEHHSYKTGTWNVRTLKCACCFKKFSNAQRYITD
jgi:hypothetical protein